MVKVPHSTRYTKQIWKRCFSKCFLSPITHYCTCSYKKHLNNDCLHNIAAVIFHMYMVAEWATPKKKYIKYLYFIHTYCLSKTCRNSLV